MKKIVISFLMATLSILMMGHVAPVQAQTCSVYTKEDQQIITFRAVINIPQSQTDSFPFAATITGPQSNTSFYINHGDCIWENDVCSFLYTLPSYTPNAQYQMTIDNYDAPSMSGTTCVDTYTSQPPVESTDPARLGACTKVSGITCSQASGERDYTCTIGSDSYCCTSATTCQEKRQSVNEEENPGSGDSGAFDSESGALDSSFFDRVNPLKRSELKADGVSITENLSTPRGIISRVLYFAFPAAGLILFVMIFWGGFEVLSGASSKKSLDAGKQRITAAIIGFVLLFASYWLVRLIEMIFGVKIV